jgi:hypothetical protein
MQHFRRMCCLHIQTTLKIKAACSFEMSVFICQNTWHHIPEDNSLHVLCTSSHRIDLCDHSLAYFPYFEKIKAGLCDLHESPPLTFDCLNQSLLNLVCISWHLSPSQRRTLSLCVCMCIPPIAARQTLGKVYPSFHC